MKKFLVYAAILALACPLTPVAAEKNAPPTSGDAGASKIDLNKMIRTESHQPIDMNEPMPTGMARKGMKKGDVKAHAMKKQAIMNEKMKQEEMRK